MGAASSADGMASRASWLALSYYRVLFWGVIFSFAPHRGIFNLEVIYHYTTDAV